MLTAEFYEGLNYRLRTFAGSSFALHCLPMSIALLDYSNAPMRVVFTVTSVGIVVRKTGRTLINGRQCWDDLRRWLWTGSRGSDRR